MRHTLLLTTLALSALTACKDSGNGEDTAGTSTVGIWTLGSTPCTGSRVDALECDDADTCYVGCGQNAEGVGLFLSSDAGGSWDAPDDEAGGYFATMRVNHLSRGDDGLLYVAGEGSSSYRVVSLDTDSGALGAVYTNGSTVDYSFTAGSFATTGDTMVAESLTGTGIVVKHPGDSAWLAEWEANDGWAAGYGWWNNSGESGHVQVLDMGVVSGEIVGAGSTINYPPVVYLPPQSWDFGSSSGGDYADQMWETVVLNEGAFSQYIGECWGIDGNSDGLAVACVDQDADRAMVYTIGSDWKTSAYDASNWTESDLSTVLSASLVQDHSTWTRQVCRGPDNLVVAVGADTQDDTGWMATSTDGGSTWTDHTDDIVEAYGDSFSALFQCQVVDDHIVAAGAGVMIQVAVADL
ncbi:MAG: hypothetical protein VX899_11110 [Myxococcota bacterium]|nr:hypothetical protein [Myxococcota bacterium]